VILFVIANLTKFVSIVFEPFMPSFSAKINHILGVKRTEKDETMIEYLLKTNDHNSLIRILPPQQQLNKPIPLFAEITPEDVHNYRGKYGGQTQ